MRLKKSNPHLYTRSLQEGGILPFLLPMLAPLLLKKVLKGGHRGGGFNFDVYRSGVSQGGGFSFGRLLSSGLVRTIFPFLKNMGKSIGKSLVHKGIAEMPNIMSGKAKPKQLLKAMGKTALSQATTDVMKKMRGGGGRVKVKRVQRRQKRRSKKGDIFSV